MRVRLVLLLCLCAAACGYVRLPQSAEEEARLLAAVKASSLAACIGLAQGLNADDQEAMLSRLLTIKATLAAAAGAAQPSTDELRQEINYLQVSRNPSYSLAGRVFRHAIDSLPQGSATAEFTLQLAISVVSECHVAVAAFVPQ